MRKCMRVQLLLDIEICSLRWRCHMLSVTFCTCVCGCLRDGDVRMRHKVWAIQRRTSKDGGGGHAVTCGGSSSDARCPIWASVYIGCVSTSISGHKSHANDTEWAGQHAIPSSEGGLMSMACVKARATCVVLSFITPGIPDLRVLCLASR